MAKKVAKKILKYLAITLLCLSLFAVLVAYYFLDTTHGLKQAIAMANRYSGYTIQVGEINGALLEKTTLKDVAIKGEGLHFFSEVVFFELKPSDLWGGRLTIHKVLVKNSLLELKLAAKKPPPMATKKPRVFNDFKLPFALQLERLEVKHLTLRQAKAKEIAIEHLQMGARYQNHWGEINITNLQGKQGRLDLTGRIETRGDFPVTLISHVQYHMPQYADERVKIRLGGSLKRALKINIVGEGLSVFNLVGQVKTPLKSPQFGATLQLKKLATAVLGSPKTVATANVQINGQWDNQLQLKASGQAFYQSPQTEQLRLDFEGLFDGKQLLIPKLNVGLLTAKQQLRGRASYRIADQKIALNLDSRALQWPQKQSAAAVFANKLQLAVRGTLANYRLTMTTDINTAKTKKIPLDIRATGSTQAIDDLSAVAKINGHPLTLNGQLSWRQGVLYKGKIVAPEIKGLAGFPHLKALAIQFLGDENHYKINGKTQMLARHAPPADVLLTVNGTPQRLQLARLLFRSREGVATIDARGGLLPLDLTATVVAKDLQPQFFYKKISGHINTKIAINAKQVDGKMHLVAKINQLGGRFQQQPLAGHGVITFDQAQQRLAIAGLMLDVAGNRLEANGKWALDASSRSDLTAKIDAQQLARLQIPSLAGRLVMNLRAQGERLRPEIHAEVEGHDLAFKSYQLAQIKGNIDTHFRQDKIQLTATLKGLEEAGERIESADISVLGRLSQHQIKVRVNPVKTSALPQLHLLANGGVNLSSWVWSGRVNQLDMTESQSGSWRLAHPVGLSVGANQLGVKLFCLQQHSASLCIKGHLRQNNGQFDVQVNHFKTAQLVGLMPQNIRVNTTINGSAKLKITQGRVSVKGHLGADKGRLKLQLGEGVLTDNLQQLKTDFSLKDNRLKTSAILRLEKIGALNLGFLMPQITRPDMVAKIKINSQNLAFLAAIAPQLSAVSGRLNGEMSLSGNPRKKLNVAGKMSLQAMNFDVPQLGTKIRALNLDIVAKNKNQLVFKGGAQSGGGRLAISGRLNPLDYRGEIAIKGANFQAANTNQYQVVINPDVKIVFADVIKVRGAIVIPKARIAPSRFGSKVMVSEDVILPNAQAEKPVKNNLVDVDLNIRLGDDIRVSNDDIETQLHGGIRVVAKPGAAISASGAIAIKAGELKAYGQKLTIQHGRIIFGNGPIGNPTLDIRATRTIGEVTVGVNVLGYANQPEISLFSNPAMADASTLSYLIFGKPPDSQNFSALALLKTGGLIGTNRAAKSIKSATGLDVLDISLSELEAGKNLSKKVYVGIRSAFFDQVNALLLNYNISTSAYLKASVSSGASTVDLVKIIETD